MCVSVRFYCNQCNDVKCFLIYDRSLFDISARTTLMRKAAFAFFIVATVLLEPAPAHAQQLDIFSIGSKNGSHTEFDQNHEAGRTVLYKVGESSAEKDWPAYQRGSLDSIVGRSTMQHDWTEVHPDPLPEPFQVQF